MHVAYCIDENAIFRTAGYGGHGNERRSFHDILFIFPNLGNQRGKYYHRLRSGKWSWYVTVSRNSGKCLPRSVKVGLEHHERENGPDAGLEIVSAPPWLNFGFLNPEHRPLVKVLEAKPRIGHLPEQRCPKV